VPSSFHRFGCGDFRAFLICSRNSFNSQNRALRLAAVSARCCSRGLILKPLTLKMDAVSAGAKYPWTYVTVATGRFKGAPSLIRAGHPRASGAGARFPQPYTGRGRCRAGNHGAISEGGPERLPGSSSRGAISVSLEGWRQRRHSAFSPSDSNPTHRAISRAAIHRLCPVHIAGTVKIFADGPRTRVIVRCAIDSGLDWRRN
jgi:hypothetical protein